MKSLLISFIIVTITCTTSLYAKKDPIPVSWDMMKGLNYETGDMSTTVNQLKGKKVTLEGFIVPLELDEFIDTVKEFLLVPNPLACIHVPPPSPNQMVFVTMKKAIPLDMDYRGVAITGKLHFPPHKTLEGFLSFKMTGTSAKEANIEFDDPLFDLLEAGDVTGSVYEGESTGADVEFNIN